ncbi:MAG: hypothetical protein BWX64_02801 [Acidobacteria bacterium ADurb.Bin051]|nr:MAG: hypothetical protein BWX64_02801 [Acidobacteria bacterium ADurb.Bin051]
MVAERPLGVAYPGRHAADEGDLGRGDERMRPRPRHPPEPFAGEQRGEEELGHVLRQRRDRGEDQRRRPAEEDRRRQLGAPRLGRGVMEAAPLADLPVHAGETGAVDLHPVDPEVVPLTVRVLGVDERQGEEGSAILRPAGEGRKAVERHVVGHDLRHRPPPSAAETDPAGLPQQIPGPPELRGGGREERRDELGETPHEGERPAPEGELGPAGGAEEVRGERQLAALDVREEERRTARGDHPPVDLRDLQPGVGRGRHLHEIAIAAEAIEEGAQVGEALGAGVGHAGMLSARPGSSHRPP